MTKSIHLLMLCAFFNDKYVDFGIYLYQTKWQLMYCEWVCGDYMNRCLAHIIKGVRKYYDT